MSELTERRRKSYDAPCLEGRDPCRTPAHSVFGHRFRDETLLEAALSHPSSVDSSLAHLRRRYQQLEFLGDAVWNCCISEALISLLPGSPEGELSLCRARLVSAAALAELAKSLDLPPLLFLSKGEESTGGRERASILSGGFEAVIGAIYLDGGGALIRRLARSVCDDQLTGAGLPRSKTTLQQLTQSRFTKPLAIIYFVVPALPCPNIRGRSPSRPIGNRPGSGPKQDAEQEAARLAMAALDTHYPQYLVAVLHMTTGPCNRP
jgi:ribonuclease-3